MTVIITTNILQPNIPAFFKKSPLVRYLKQQAQKGFYDGFPGKTMAYLDQCRAMYSGDPTVVLIFTRDINMHVCGWLKNPDYERCFHLSLSFYDSISGESDQQIRGEAKKWCYRFFGKDNCRYLWVESPYSDKGKERDVYHYRMFCNPGWSPIIPRGEVYSKEFTEIGWKGFSEQHPNKIITGER